MLHLNIFSQIRPVTNPVLQKVRSTAAEVNVLGTHIRRPGGIQLYNMTFFPQESQLLCYVFRNSNRVHAVFVKCAWYSISLIPTGLHSISNRATLLLGEKTGLQVKPAPEVLRSTVNLWSVWALPRWLMNCSFLAAVLMLTRLSLAQFKKKEEAKEIFIFC